MSLFGSSHEQTPSLEPETSAADSKAPESNQPAESESAPEPEHIEDAGSDGHSDEDDGTSSRLSGKTYQQYRRWYYNDLNLVKAFESAAASDLAHNLLGLALEKKGLLKTRSAIDAQSWTSKRRWLDESEGELARTIGSWTAWPLLPEHVPTKVEILSDPLPSKFAEPVRKRRKVLRPSSELEEVLAGLGMEHAREQFSAHKRRIANESSVSMCQGTKKRTTEIEPLAFSMDEEHSFAVLNPVVKQTMAKTTQLFASLKSSRAAQLPRKPRHRHQKASQLPGSYNRKSKRNRGNISDDEDLSDATAPASYGFSTKDKPDLRDWSEILGMAANIGWSTNALSRTVVRCSEMFGETMSLSSLKHSKTLNPEVGLGHVDSQPPPIALTGWSLNSLQCPHSDCERHWRKLRNPMYLIAHIRSAHHWDPKEGMAQVFSRAPNIQGWSLEGLRCPHTDCTLYDHLFAEKRALVSHILRCHNWDPRTQPKGSERLVDGVHVDGFLETIGRPRVTTRVNSPGNAIDIVE
jgi:hypothetical protein